MTDKENLIQKKNKPLNTEFETPAVATTDINIKELSLLEKEQKIDCNDETEKFSDKNTNTVAIHWVGIGASAGGLEALREMIKKLPKRANNITYIVVQHLSPKHKSMMVQLLGRETTMPVEEVLDGIVPQAGVVYITPPDSDVFVKEGKMRLREPMSEHSPKPSVDLFFTTMAEEIGDHAIGVILSGTGSDGAHGVRAVRAGGGLTIAQNPKTAKYDGMPNKAISTGCVDIILPSEQIGPQIASLIRSPHHLQLLQNSEEKRTAMQELMHLLKLRSGVDFKDYKEGTLWRRLNRRMTACSVNSLEDYLEFVESNSQELDLLFRDIMITVTQFFRDKEAFDDVKEKIKEIIAEKQENDNIRVWVPGCATGEEAYSIIVLFAEAAGGLSQLQQRYDFQVFATDIDVESLGLARKGVYAQATLEEVEVKIREKYFRHKENNYEIIKSVRDMVVFSKHNVFDDPPFLRLDLISCRNVLIYFNNNLQNTVLNLFHYALNPTGVLFLGKSEALGHSSNLFHATNSKAKLFKRKIMSPNESRRGTRLTYSAIAKVETSSTTKRNQKNHDLPDAIIKALSPNSLLIDENMEILRIYGDVQSYTQLSAGEVSTNLSSLARKEFRQELRALIYKVLREGREETVLPKKLNINGKMHRINIAIRPLLLKNSAEKLLLISFEKINSIKDDATESHRSESDPIVAELEQELSATREHLQTVVEELETSNEEMQSSNEELQSSNEELETANEELQSTNEELLTVNEELQIKSSELSLSNEDLENIKGSIDIPLLVVDNDLVVTRFNKAACDIFMLDKQSEGTALTAIASRIDIPNLRENVLNVIQFEQNFSRQLETAHKYYSERILPYRDENNHVKGAVLTYVDNTQEQKALLELKEIRERYDLAVEGSNAGIWNWDIKTDSMHWSQLFKDMIGITQENYNPTFELFISRIHEEDRPDVFSIIQAHLQRGFEFNVEFRMRTESNDYLWIHARGQATWDKNKKPIRMTGSVYDITDRRQTLDDLSRTNESLARFAYVCSHDLKEPARIIENFTGLFRSYYETELDDRAKEFLRFIEESATRMQEMIKGILTYSQLENKNLQLDEVVLEDEVKKALKNLKLVIEENDAEICIGKLPVIKADRMQLFQVMQNLLGNALKFWKVGRKPHVEVTSSESEDEWTIAVKDNGIGMKIEHSHKIFNVFQRLNRREDYDGSGIGLSICQKIVAKHGGRIWVESELDKGSSFFFTIPKKKKRS